MEVITKVEIKLDDSGKWVLYINDVPHIKNKSIAEIARILLRWSIHKKI